jgi:hypothetical protein
MAAKVFRWSSLRGFNRRDVPQSLPVDIAVSCDNVELREDTLGRRRPTVTTMSLTSGPSTTVSYLFTHYPADSLTPDLWAATSSALYRRASGTWASATLADAFAGDAKVHAASLNGKVFWAFNSAENRLHVWDGTSVRRVGIKKSAAPTVANTGAGAYAATARYYRVAWRIKSGSTVVATSELSDAVSFTPSGGGTAARVTKPTTPDSATHWVLYGLIGTSGDVYDLYEELAETAVGTTTYDDSTNPSAYDGDAPAPLGYHVPPPSARLLLSTGNRLLMAGAYATSAASGETTPKKGRVWFTPVLGASGRGDDECLPNTVDQKNYIDVGEEDGDDVMALAGPIEGVVYVIKARSIWQLFPTGIDTAPFREEKMAAGVGAFAVGFTGADEIYNQYNTVMFDDEMGRPAIYFVATIGVYRITASGVEFVGHDMRDPDTGYGPTLWHGAAVRARRQIWWIDPSATQIYVYTPALARRMVDGPYGWRGGWTRYTFSHLSTDTFQAIVGDGVVDANFLAYPVAAGGVVPSLTLYEFDANSTTDNGTQFTASVTSGAFLLGHGTHNVRAESPHLEAAVQSNATPSVAYVLDYGRETRTGTAPSLSASGSETRKSVHVEDLEATDCGALQVKVTWDTDHSNLIDAVRFVYTVGEPR